MLFIVYDVMVGEAYTYLFIYIYCIQGYFCLLVIFFGPSTFTNLIWSSPGHIKKYKLLLIKQ